MMIYRLLGSTGLIVSKLGFGCWGIGGLTEGATSYGPTDDKESERALNFAFERGVNFFDTSNIYGNGHSEELLGSVFKDKRDKVIIATKGGYVSHGTPSDFSAGYLRKSLEGSLVRLKTDYVDLFQLHSPPLEALENGEVVCELEQMKKEGKIRACGISVQNPHDGVIAVEKYGFKAVQVNFNMIDQRALDVGLLRAAIYQEARIIARTPLGFGFLSGYYRKVDFSKADHRSQWPLRQLEKWSQAPMFFEPLNRKKRRTLAQLALSFCLHYEAVATVIPGMMRVSEVEENLGIFHLPRLIEEEAKEINLIYRNNSFFG